MKRFRAPCVLAVSLAACVIQTGHPATEDRRVVSPLGIAAQLTHASGAAVEGELLAVDSSAYVLLARARVTVVPMKPSVGALLQGGESNSRTLIRVSGIPAAGKLREVRSHARFPYGIPQPAMAALLASTGQTAPDTLWASLP